MNQSTMKAPKRNRKPQRKGLRYNEMRKRLARGEPLLPEQLATLESIVHGPPRKAAVTKAGPRFVPNVNQLARALGVSRQLVAWHSRQPDAPPSREDGRKDVAAWREYLARHGRLATVGRTSGKTEIGRLKLSQLVLVNRKLKTQLAVLEKLHTSVADAREAGDQLSNAIRRIVSDLHKIAPRVVGVSVPEAEAVLKAEEDRLMEQLHTISVPGKGE